MGARPEILELVESVVAVDAATADLGRCTGALARLQRLRGWLDATDARITARIAELHAAGEARPPADVHAGTRGCSNREARDKERRAETIGRTPELGEALEAGEIGAAHVDAVASAVASTPADIATGVLADTDRLLADASTLSPERFARRLRDRIRQLEERNGIDRDAQRRRDSFLGRRLDMGSGMTIGNFALHPELAAKVFGAIDREVGSMMRAGEAAGDPEFVERRVDRRRLAAEAWGRLVGRQPIAAGGPAGAAAPARASGPTPTVADISVIIDAVTLATGELHDRSVCETQAGAPIPVSLVERLGCDGFVTGVVVDQHGTALHVGRTRRHATPAQRRALAQQYRTCAFPGCEVDYDNCEIHHITPWVAGGRTDLHELVPACSHHHHELHANAWRLHLAPDRTLTVTDRHGNVIGRASPPHRRPDAA